MTCDQALADLVSYHFDVLDPDARRALEEHLCACPSCVRAFVETKRAVELGSARPSDVARARIRRAVAAEVSPSRRPWERPFAFAIAASVLLVAGAATQALTSAEGAAPFGWPAQHLRR
jgi:anti-sigma factor RsiW